MNDPTRLSSRAQKKAVARWREQGRTEEEIDQGLATWGEPREPYVNRKAKNDLVSMVNPFVGLSYDELMALRTDLRREMGAIRLQAARLDAMIGLVNSAIVAAEPPALLVSDHAVLRYLERTQGLDVHAMREEIRKKAEAAEPGDSGARIVDLGDCKVVISQSVVQNLTVDPTVPGGLRSLGSRNAQTVVTTLAADMCTGNEWEEAKRALAGKALDPVTDD